MEKLAQRDWRVDERRDDRIVLLYGGGEGGHAALAMPLLIAVNVMHAALRVAAGDGTSGGRFAPLRKPSGNAARVARASASHGYRLM